MKKFNKNSTVTVLAVFFVFVVLGSLSLVSIPRQALALGTDATLSALTTNVGTLSPSFDPAIKADPWSITIYNLLLPDGTVIATFPVTATPNDPNATVAYQMDPNREMITVTAQDGRTTQWYRVDFVYPPTITNITSASGSAAGGDVVLISGSNFSEVTAVYFGTNTTKIIYKNYGAIIVSSPAGTGTVDVTVGNGVATSSTSSVDQFTYVVPDGTITLPTTLNPDGTLSGTIIDATIASTTSGGFPVISYIPAGTTITGHSTWNGMVYPPTNNLPVAPVAVAPLPICTIGMICAIPEPPEPSSVYSILIPPQGTATSTRYALLALLAMSPPVSSIDIGFGSTPLSLTNHAVRIVVVGGAGTAVGYTHDWGSFTPITNVCSADSQAAGDALLATPGADCYINPVGSSDLVVWTTHFSNFTNTSGLVGISPSGSIVITSGSIATPLVPTVGSLVVIKDTVGGDGTFSFISSDGSSFFITTTNGTGSYIIADLVPGTYTITEGKQPKGWKQTGNDCSAVTVTAGNIASCTITDTKNEAQKLGEIRGTVYKSNNERQKSDHAKGDRLSGVTVYLDLNNDGKFENGEPFAVTNRSGKYQFANLALGAYHVREVVPKKLKVIMPTTGVYNITLTAGQVSKKNNFVNSNNSNNSNGEISKNPVNFKQ